MKTKASDGRETPAHERTAALLDDALPSSRLSGEWADSLTAADVLDWYDLDEDGEAAEDVLSAFEDGYSRGVQDEAMRSARAVPA